MSAVVESRTLVGHDLDRRLEEVDPEVAAAIRAEEARLQDGLELIASENYAGRAVREATASVLTNKYAEGYPGRRYYGGCENVDVVEQLAIERAKALFRAEHANVQPHAGSQANLAAYLALLEPGETILAMRLDQGGHLTHGSPVNFSGKLFNIVAYGVDRETERIDYDEVARLAREHRPRMIVAGATAYPRVIEFERFAEIAGEVGAYFMVDMAHIAGLVATRLHPDPVPVSDIVTTTTHKTLRGPRSGMILCREEHAKAVDKAVFPFSQGGPLEHVIAAKAVALREAAEPGFVDYQRQVIANAQALADGLMSHGFRIVSGGTDNHLMLVDLTSRDVTGKDAERALDRAAITVNKNMIPFDPRSPFVTSGLRLGTPMVTTRGMREPEMRQVAAWIAAVIDHIDDDDTIARVRSEVQDVCRQRPVPGIDVA